MTHDTDAKPDEIVVECEMEAAPETVWRALTDENLAADWLGAQPASEGKEAPGSPSYSIVEAKPYSRVRYAWHDPDCPDAPPIVTVELERLAGGRTRFRLTHGEAVMRVMQTANTNTPPLALAA